MSKINPSVLVCHPESKVVRTMMEDNNGCPVCAGLLDKDDGKGNPGTPTLYCGNCDLLIFVTKQVALQKLI